MISLFHLAAELQRVFLAQQWKFCFIGGIAIQHWGEPRLTRDVDVTLLTGIGNEGEYIDTLCKHYHPRIPDLREFALQNRVVLLESERKIPIDIALAAFPFEELVISRAQDHFYMEGVTLRICSAEDLVVLKAFADRTRDWGDIEGIFLKQGNSLDWDYIRKQLAGLCELKESPEILDKLTRLYKNFMEQL